jgi:hypothetical protein
LVYRSFNGRPIFPVVPIFLRLKLGRSLAFNKRGGAVYQDKSEASAEGIDFAQQNSSERILEKIVDLGKRIGLSSLLSKF